MAKAPKNLFPVSMGRDEILLTIGNLKSLALMLRKAAQRDPRYHARKLEEAGQVDAEIARLQKVLAKTKAKELRE